MDLDLDTTDLSQGKPQTPHAAAWRRRDRLATPRAAATAWRRPTPTGDALCRHLATRRPPGVAPRRRHVPGDVPRHRDRLVTPCADWRRPAPLPGDVPCTAAMPHTVAMPRRDASRRRVAPGDAPRRRLTMARASGHALCCHGLVAAAQRHLAPPRPPGARRRPTPDAATTAWQRPVPPSGDVATAWHRPVRRCGAPRCRDVPGDSPCRCLTTPRAATTACAAATTRRRAAPRRRLCTLAGACTGSLSTTLPPLHCNAPVLQRSAPPRTLVGACAVLFLTLSATCPLCHLPPALPAPCTARPLHCPCTAANAPRRTTARPRSHECARVRFPCPAPLLPCTTPARGRFRRRAAALHRPCMLPGVCAGLVSLPAAAALHNPARVLTPGAAVTSCRRPAPPAHAPMSVRRLVLDARHRCRPTPRRHSPWPAGKIQEMCHS
ncbi:hypothetical protein GGX14DRAFT_564177 [Mycena pura]|uniref:Uncharacterized protein n=1 Tax=Mycena pura TaxID=153505 RepID=A0AAD6VIP5_9AGAR|nr:hypothetical protein GGX14DRAFT_564177 [Mycena pura]